MDNTASVIGISAVAEEKSGQKQRMEVLEDQVRERTSALEMLHDVASMANQAQSVEEAVQYCLRRVAEHNGWSFGHAFLPAKDEPDLLMPGYAWYSRDADAFRGFRDLTLKTTIQRDNSLPWRVYEVGKPDWTTDISRELTDDRAKLAEELGVATLAAFPVMVAKRVVGVIEFFSEKPIDPQPEMLEAMASVGMQLGRVIERKAFQDQLLTLSEEEQRRIGQELHDDVGQELTGLALTAETLAELLRDDNGPIGRLARGILSALVRTRRKTQALSRSLVPAEVDGAGLEAALENLALQMDEKDATSCRFRCSGNQRVADSQTATQLYRIAHEAITNVLSNGRLDRIRDVEILLDTTASAIELRIRDKEAELPLGDDRRAEMGLQIMRYRARLIGALLSIEPSAVGGVCVVCTLPQDNSRRTHA